MPELFGHTRARVAARHALITADNHVGSCLPGIDGATAIVLISPAMGAGFTQILLTFQSGGGAIFAASETETFGYIATGGVAAAVGLEKRRLGPGGFFFAPAGNAWSLAAPKAGTQVT